MNFTREVFFIEVTNQIGNKIGSCIHFPQPYFVRHNEENCELTQTFVKERVKEWTGQDVLIELPDEVKKHGFCQTTYLFLEGDDFGFSLNGVALVSEHFAIEASAILSCFCVCDDDEWSIPYFHKLRNYYRDHRKNVQWFLISPEKERKKFWKKQGFERDESKDALIENAMKLQL